MRLTKIWGNFHLAFFLCLLDAVLHLASADSNNDTLEFVSCDEGWYIFGDQCYKAGGYEEGLVWTNASIQCENWGGKLVSIHSEELNDFLTIMVLGALKQSAWIGLVDQDEKNFITERKQANISWEDGSSLDYENWAEGEPSPSILHGYEGCGELMFSIYKEKLGKWNDLSCKTTQAFICEKPSNKSVEASDKRFCSGNEEGGWKFHKSCFHVITEEKSWDDAQLHCQEQFNGNLVTILDYATDAFLNYILSASENQYWIGIKVKVQKNQLLKWNSQWHVAFNYHFDRSLEDLPDGTCILKKNETQWIATSCTEKHAFICERTNDTAPFLPTIKDVSCPEDNAEWLDLGGESCYFFDTNSSVTWYNALRDCINRGGTLASIRSKEQAQIFNNLLQYRRWSLHIGLTSIPSHGFKYVWTDLSNLNYTNWAPNEPNQHSEKCGEFITASMQWNDIDCSRKFGYICEVKKSNPKMKTGRLDTLGIFENHMLHLSNGALQIILQPVEQPGEQPGEQPAEQPGDTSNSVVIGICVFVVLLAVSVGVLGYFSRHWIREKTAKLTSVYYKSYDSSKNADSSVSPMILKENE